MAVNMALTSLLVCSDAQAVQVLGGVLQDMGVTVESCGDLRMARARLEDAHYDAVLVDCQNEPAAIELIAQSRNNSPTKTVVVIAIVNGLNDVRAILAKGANFILYKPISRERAGHGMRAARGLMQRERRIRPRIPLQTNTSVAYAGKENVPAALLDLSENGIAFHSDDKLAPHCKVYFQFSPPGSTSLIRLSGEVMWQDSSGRVGIRFSQVPQTSRRVLNNWLEANLDKVPETVLTESQVANGDDDSILRLSAGLGLMSGSAGDRRNLLPGRRGFSHTQQGSHALHPDRHQPRWLLYRDHRDVSRRNSPGYYGAHRGSEIAGARKSAEHTPWIRHGSRVRPENGRTAETSAAVDCVGSVGTKADLGLLCILERMPDADRLPFA
jgi:CheY-like chemotaxis protein